MLRRHHNRPLASYRADFLPCRGNREIERKERRRERERERERGGRDVAQSTKKGTNVESSEKREILNESKCLTGGEKDRSRSEKFEGRERVVGRERGKSSEK